MKIYKTPEEFEKETGFPAVGTEAQLSKFGAVYMASRPIIHQGSKMVRDIMVYNGSNGTLFIWNREFPEDLFQIHRAGKIFVEFIQKPFIKNSEQTN